VLFFGALLGTYLYKRGRGKIVKLASAFFMEFNICKDFFAELFAGKYFSIDYKMMENAIDL